LIAVATKEELASLMRGTTQFISCIAESEESLDPVEYLHANYAKDWTQRAFLWLEGALDEALCIHCQGVAAAKATAMSDLDTCCTRLNSVIKTLSI
jgi:hypothetical protein